ncbi:FKBP-type peptidyl-prolyl cis-trans isomerase [Bdellovibrio bacteriovorus]|uniref:Peptidyl-prolyl cis-trans isomerase n=1 Tax=Bdellovibrio reynosensis TaxID=2835041 RepID=A0ABY4CH90_9BACT|nr:FKBP-type peptidyl-prolyl cis-trans isomerase [Bdellovibrio reynosensis]UOF01585.1 FKBP-type peptidyl-prolyl cis-trans isomerase [Bdellovibrio reynosensis]
MNKLVVGGLVVAALGFTTACQKKVKLDTDMKKASYAIGQQIGGNLKQQNIDFDADALAQALKDASAGKNEMSKEDMQAAMMKLQEMAMKKQQEAADTNAKAGKDFLEKNKSAANVKTTASGLQYIVEKEGTGASPKKEDVVKVHYKGTLTNGEQFDSSYDRGQPAEFPVGGVIPGWTEALQLMKVGGKSKLFIPPELAYGPSGRPGIPPNSVLVFEVELIDIVKQQAAAKKTK